MPTSTTNWQDRNPARLSYLPGSSPKSIPHPVACRAMLQRRTVRDAHHNICILKSDDCGRSPTITADIGMCWVYEQWSITQSAKHGRPTTSPVSCLVPPTASADHSLNPLECRSNYSATSNNMKLVYWPLMGGLLHLVQWGGDWAGPQPAQTQM